MIILQDVDERIQSHVIQEAQRLNIEPQQLVSDILERFITGSRSKNDYVSVNERGAAYLTGRRIKVAHVVMESVRNGLSPDAVARSYDLSLAQVHAALS